MNYVSRLFAAVCVSAVLLESASAAQIENFPDAQGHWAYTALEQAVHDGLLQGDEGRLLPSGSLTTAQMTAILNRVLKVENSDRIYPDTPAGQWYTFDASKGASLGILPIDGSLKLEHPITRAEVFAALTAAFGLDEAAPDEAILDSFTDAASLSPVQRRAAAVLLRDSILSGTQDGSLQASRGITRAEFVSLLYRIINGSYLPALTEPTPEESGEPSQISFYTTMPQPDASLASRVILRGENMAEPFTEGDPVSIDRLVLATTGTDLTLQNENRNTFRTIVIAGGTGRVTLASGVTRQLEITGSDRSIDLRGLHLDQLILSGSKNTILADESTSISTLTVLPGAFDNHITIHGSLQNAALSGARNLLDGTGKASSVTVSGSHCTVSLAADKVDDSTVNPGLDGIQVRLVAPQVAPGGPITATATVTGVTAPLTCTAQWFFDGKPDKSFVNSSFDISEGRTSSYHRAIKFTKDMPLHHTIGLVLSYYNPMSGETEKIISDATAVIENYPASHYLPSPKEVLAKVHPTYRPNNTDYTQDEKTVFVNAKGYSSRTKYLLWVSRSAQKVNIFEGSQGNWKLIQEFACATGKPGSSTPLGVTHVTYKQPAWVTSSYTCRPIVRFYPGTGYAFHSRLYYPGTNKLKDPSIGFPVSAGCVRMLDEGINWIYNHVPAYSTVVIY